MRALLGLAIAAACTSRAHDPAPAPAEGGPSDHRTPCDGAGAPCNDVYVVAHPDDDLLFMNPDIENSIATGNNVTVVVLTAGDVYVDDLAKDCGKPSHDDPEVYWRDRERGMLNAYAHMARKQAFDAYVEGNAVPPDWRRIADPGHTGMSVDGLELAGYQLELGSCGHVGCERQKVRVIFFRFADIQLQCLWNNTPGCLGGGYHPEIAKPAELEWARGSCAHHDELSCTGDADCPAGDTCANLPQQVAGTCAKHPDTACYSSWGCPSGDTCANASCAGCVVRTGTYYAYTLGCATTATRTCSGTSACVFPGDGGDRCCTACTTTPASDQCPLGTEIPEQKVVGRDQLIRILAALFTRLEADSVSTLDASNLNFDVLGDPDGSGYHEFWTHYYTGLFTLAALADAQATTTTHIAPRMYRDYTVDQEPQNLSFSGAQQLQKRQTFARYFLFDDKSRLASGTIDDPKFGARDYDVGYEYRMYAARALVGTRELHGRLRVATGGCLLGDATIGDCAAAPSWTLTTTNQIELAGTARCLTVAAAGGHTLNPAAGGGHVAAMPDEAVGLGPCQDTANSTLLVFANGQIRTPGARCLAAGAGGAVSSDCKQLCADASGHTVEDVYCQGLPGMTGFHVQGIPPADQDFTLIFDAAQLVTSELGDDTEIPTSPSYYRTFTLAHGNVCVRRALAVECAAADGDPSHLQPATIVTEMFADASGWFGKNGESVTAVWDQAGDQMIACGRDGHGVRCSNGLDTSELAGFGSIRFPDLGRRVATTGALSVCGRGHAGVACARNAGGRWPATTLWSPVYADGGGWDQPVYGDTVQLADLDNDGRIDVCGRSHYGLLCAVQSRRGSYAFESEHLWTFDEARDASGGQPSKDGSTTDYDATAEDFSDRDAGGIWPSALAYYGTIQLVDVNHDGFADACGRAPDGIYCAFSTGVGFERKRLVVPLDFTDAQGWADPSHGATLRLGDLAGDGRIAACGRSAAGVVCAEGY